MGRGGPNTFQIDDARQRDGEYIKEDRKEWKPLAPTPELDNAPATNTENIGLTYRTLHYGEQ